MHILQMMARMNRKFGSTPPFPPQMTAMSLIQSLEEHNEVMLFIPILEKLPASLITMCQIKNINSVN